MPISIDRIQLVVTDKFSVTETRLNDCLRLGYAIKNINEIVEEISYTIQIRINKSLFKRLPPAYQVDNQTIDIT